MSFDNDSTFDTGWNLNIDADSIVYAQCCVYNDYSDGDKQRIIRGIQRKVQELTLDAGCDSSTCFLTTKTNFRDDLVTDYKFNRSKTARPVNLAWAKGWVAKNMDSVYKDKLEADDLLGIYSGDKTVIWSIDKDLRQIPGKHLDENTRKVITITELGTLIDLGKKIYFDGLAGFYLQCLMGDPTDYIVGCGKRLATVYKSGAKEGEVYTKRSGIGQKAAYKLLKEAYRCAVKDSGNPAEAMLNVVTEQYKLLHGDIWQSQLETQANLLFMVREMEGNLIKRWTFDGRDEWFDLTEGVIREAA